MEFKCHTVVKPQVIKILYMNGRFLSIRVYYTTTVDYIPIALCDVLQHLEVPVNKINEI